MGNICTRFYRIMLRYIQYREIKIYFYKFWGWKNKKKTHSHTWLIRTFLWPAHSSDIIFLNFCPQGYLNFFYGTCLYQESQKYEPIVLGGPMDKNPNYRGRQNMQAKKFVSISEHVCMGFIFPLFLCFEWEIPPKVSKIIFESLCNT